MLARIIRAVLFVAVSLFLPLIARPELIPNIKIQVLATAGLLMLLSQPDLKREEAVNSRKTDRWSVVAILVAGILSQVLPVIEWAYFGSASAEGTAAGTVLGLVMMIGGLVFRIWSIRTLGKFFTATVQIVDGHRVIKHGPYAVVRHPSYLGAYVTLVGSGVFLGAGIGTLMGAILLVAAYRMRLRTEEATLLEAFGDEYRAYARTVPRIFPGLY